MNSCSLCRKESLQTFSGHERGINCVYFDGTKIISASYDNKVKIWDFNVVPPSRQETTSAMTQTDVVTPEAPECVYQNIDS